MCSVCTGPGRVALGRRPQATTAKNLSPARLNGLVEERFDLAELPHVIVVGPFYAEIKRVEVNGP